MSKAQPSRVLTEGSVDAHLRRMTLPMTWGILAVLSKSVVDTYFVGQLGLQELSAISFTFPVVLALASLAIGLGAGAASLVARAIGQGDQHLVQRRSTDALSLSLLVVIAASILGVVTIAPLFGIIGASGRILDLVAEYMVVWYVGMPLLVVPMVGNSLIRAAGDARIPGLIMGVAALVNALLDPWFIFGGLGIPALGIAGAAYATVVANGVAMVLAVWVLHHREHLLDWTIPSWREMRASWGQVLRIGLPASVANMINPFGVGIVTGLLAHTGTEAVAAFGAATRIESIVVVGMFALSATIGPIVGQNWGAARHARVTEAMACCYRYCIYYGVALAAVVALAAPWVMPLFSDVPRVIELSCLYLWVVPLSLFGYGINITGAAAMNAVGEPLIATALTLVRMLGIYIPLAWLLGHSYGPPGVFVAAAVANVLAGMMTVVVTRNRLRVRTVKPAIVDVI